LPDFFPVSALMPDLLEDSAGVVGIAVVSVALGAGAGAAAVVSVGVPGTAPVSPFVPALPLQAARVATTAQGKANVCHLISRVLSWVSPDLLAKRT